MAKRSTVPLYEVMVTRRRTAAAARQGETEPPPPPPSPPEEPDAPRAISRSIRVPVGYVMVAVAVVTVLVVVSYIVGALRAEEATRAEFERFFPEGAILDRAVDRDPLLARPGVAGAEARQTGPASSPGEQRKHAPAADPRGAPEWGPADSDPRREGYHYFVIAETRAEGAIRLADFCREEGLEAYVITSNNPRLRRVIVLPALSTRSDAQAGRLLEEIRRVGLAWKSRQPGESDLRDAYIIP